jgi:hypothetical protein
VVSALRDCFKPKQEHESYCLKPQPLATHTPKVAHPLLSFPFPTERQTRAAITASYRSRLIVVWLTPYVLAMSVKASPASRRANASRCWCWLSTGGPTRQHGLRILMGPFSIYDKSNVEAAAK